MPNKVRPKQRLQQKKKAQGPRAVASLKSTPKRRLSSSRASSAPNVVPASVLEELAALVATVHRLRAPGGCPWDRAQTHQSLRPYLIEEAYELLAVLDRIGSAVDLRQEELRNDFVEELGDVLLQVVLHAEIASESGACTLAEVARVLREKLVRRHPHVFKPRGKRTAKEKVQTQWEAVKAQEKAEKAAEDQSVLSGLPPALPALQKAGRIIQKVTKVGFQWPDLSGPLAKLEEEISELKTEIQRFQDLQAKAKAAPKSRNERLMLVQARLEAELGDVLFCVANLGYLLKIEPEQALRGNLARFERRFRFVENRLREQGKRPEESTLQEMDRYWDEAKATE